MKAVAKAPAGTLVLTPAEAAIELRMSVGHVHDLIRKGQLPAVTVGRRLKVKRKDLEAWIDDPGKSTVRQALWRPRSA